MTQQRLRLCVKKRKPRYRTQNAQLFLLTRMALGAFCLRKRKMEKGDRTVLISSRDNDQVKQYCRLQTSKKYRGQTGLFCLEGVRLVADALRSGLPIHSIFVTEKCLQKNHEELQIITDKRVTLHMITESVSLKMAQVQSPPGCFAIAQQRLAPLPLERIVSGCLLYTSHILWISRLLSKTKLCLSWYFRRWMPPADSSRSPRW